MANFQPPKQSVCYFTGSMTEDHSLTMNSMLRKLHKHSQKNKGITAQYYIGIHVLTLINNPERVEHAHEGQARRLIATM